MIHISKPYIGEEEKQAVLAVLESGMLAQGPRTAELEARFAQLCGVKHAIATSSGTTALQTALLAHGIGPGDEVITTPFTFIASVNTILLTGAKPVLVDIDAETFNINPGLIEKAITSRTRAMMPVHLYGYPCDMNAIGEIARRYNLAIVEDACQAIGARYQGQAVGSFGAGCFSLYATKNVMAGEGGMITTNDDAVAEACRLLRNHGMRQRYEYERLGYNFRTTDLHAAIGLAQIARLDTFTRQRRKNADYLNDRLTTVIAPRVRPGYEHVWHQYTVRLTGKRDRDTAVQKLTAAGVGAAVFYPRPAHYYPHLREAVGEASLPAAERAATEVISLPVHPLLTLADLEKIVSEVNRL